MEYKGIIFDIDGTAVPLGEIEVNHRTKEAIQNAQDSMKLSAATGRSIGYARPILESLGLTCPSVIMGGSAIIDIASNEVVWGKTIDHPQSESVLNLLRDYKAIVRFSTDPLKKNELWRKDDITEPIYTVWADEMEPVSASRLIEEVSRISDTVAHSTPSWSDGLVDVHITHASATKEHAIRVLIEELELRPAEVIGVGDSGNDVPIFRAVGHRVAMASGTEELKSLADEIAPPLNEDGLAQIIDKYSN